MVRVKPRHHSDHKLAVGLAMAKRITVIEGQVKLIRYRQVR
jgi:hypothetical protein